LRVKVIKGVILLNLTPVVSWSRW